MLVLDFYLWFVWEDGGPVPDTYEFVNGRALNTELLENESDYQLYRIQAKLYEETDLTDYPMDTQKITLKIEDSRLTEEYLVYVADKNESGISPEIVLSDWTLEEEDNLVKVSEYPQWDESYSRYVHEMSITRPASALYKILIPVLFIAVTAWLCFFIPIHQLENKLVLGGTALLSAVAFHIFLTDSIPVVGHLILADKMIIALYGMLVFSLIGFVHVDRFVAQKDRRSKSLNHLYITVAPFIPLIFFLLALGL